MFFHSHIWPMSHSLCFNFNNPILLNWHNSNLKLLFSTSSYFSTFAVTPVSFLTLHAFVSILAKMAATVIPQSTGAIDAGGIWSTCLCRGSGRIHHRLGETTHILKKINMLWCLNSFCVCGRVPEWQCSDEWCWQLLPVNPLGHAHLYKLASESSHLPPF